MAKGPWQRPDSCALVGTQGLRYHQRMDEAQRKQLLLELHRGDISRNREFEQFRDDEARRVLRGYRRLRSLLEELVRPGVRARMRWAANPGGLAVAVEDPGLRYRRVVLLAPWEVDFLLDEADAGVRLEIPHRPAVP